MKRTMAAMALVVSIFPVYAQDYGAEEKGVERIDSARDIAPQRVDTVFGDNISLYNGNVMFDVVDMAIPGNNSLPVEIRRSLNVRERKGFYSTSTEAHVSGELGGFYDWSLNIPYLYGAFPESLGWQVSGDEPYSRCSNPNQPLDSSPYHSASDFWDGYHMNIPGMGNEVLLRTAGVNKLPRPTDGTTYPLSTKSFWMISCSPTTKNGYPGEGFIAKSPHGVKYYFDWVVTRKMAGSVTYSSVGAGRTHIPRMMSRSSVFFLVSRIEDHHGNYVSYMYEGDKLKSISSSDGRIININYSENVISSADSSLGVWAYSYGPDNLLSGVTRPDGSRWSYSSEGLLEIEVDTRPFIDTKPDCPEWSTGGPPYSMEIISPYGATAKFDFKVNSFGRSYVPKKCEKPSDDLEFVLIPANTFSYALVNKQISGPGLETMNWSYAYSGPGMAWEHLCVNDPPGCVKPRKTAIQGPGPRYEEYEFGARYQVNEGRLFKKHIGASVDEILRVEEYEYISDDEVASQPFPDEVGSSMVSYSFNERSGRLRPIKRQIITQGSTASYQSITNTFDYFARSLNIVRSSPWYSRTDDVEYHDNLSKWIVGQEKKKFNRDTDLVEMQISFDENAMPYQIWSFGKLKGTFLYNSDGTLGATRDGNGNLTTFENWKRGIPQLIRHADGTSKSAVVNDSGWITSVTDENIFTTSYGYDAMGRISNIAYPGGDDMAWNPVTQTFVKIDSNEYGLAPGHWRQTVANGNARKVSYFDGLWRPLLVHEYDAASVVETQHFQRFSYNHEGKQTFTSYPSASDLTTTMGTWYEYDSLGRTTSVSQDSEHGLLTTFTEYLPGNQIRVTNPKGFQTVTGYQVFDQPDYEKPVWIMGPESSRTDIARDVFGNPFEMKR